MEGSIEPLIKLYICVNRAFTLKWNHGNAETHAKQERHRRSELLLDLYLLLSTFLTVRDSHRYSIDSLFSCQSPTVRTKNS